jgi:hypothetical protein
LTKVREARLVSIAGTALLGQPPLADGINVNPCTPPSPGLSDDENGKQASGEVHHGCDRMIATLVPMSNSAAIGGSVERPSATS